MQKIKPHKVKIQVADQARLIKILQWLPEYCGLYQHTWDYHPETYMGWPKSLVFEFLREADRDIFAMTWLVAE